MSAQLVRRVLIALSFLSSGSGTSAADFEVIPLEDITVVAITGTIEAGDENKLRQLALAHDIDVLALASEGGNLMSGIEIGKIARLQGYNTLVLDDMQCTSSCALIWLAGSKRLVGPSSQVGFHASYYENSGKLIETGLGNALVGHYLSGLGLPSEAVVFATSASPYEISWLDTSKPGSHGIQFEIFGEVSAPVAPPPIVESERADGGGFASLNSRNPPDQFVEAASHISGFGLDLTLDGLAWISANKPGRRDDYALLAADMYSERRKDIRRVWIRGYHKKNPDVPYRESKALYEFNCKLGTGALLRSLTFDSDDQLLGEWGPEEPRHIMPGSQGDEWRKLACHTL